MKLVVSGSFGVVILIFGLALRAQTPQAQTAAPTAAAQGGGRAVNNNDAFYQLGPDSLEREGVPHGKIDGPFMLPTAVYSGPLPASTAQSPNGIWG